MRKLVKLEKDLSIVFNSTITEYINPDFVYIPIKKNYHLLVKNNEKVYKGQIILENNLNKKLCPVSGKVVGVSKKNVDGTIKDVIVIENDFKEEEKNYKVKEIKYQKDIIVSKLYEFYFKYIASILESKKINNLIINTLEDEPYIANNNYIASKYSKEILEIVDIFANTFNINRSIIAIKSNDTKLLENYLSKIGTYPNINISPIDDKYLLGKPFFLLEYLNLTEIDSLVIDSKTILEIYNAIKYNKNTYETFITISGPSLKKSSVIKVKVGTLLSDVFDSKVKLANKDNLYILNGLMTGYECDIKNTIVSKNTIGVVVIPKHEEKEHECNKCGLCFKICPVKVNPKKIMDTKKISVNCLDCGLCSYVCPCHINLRKFLRGEHE